MSRDLGAMALAFSLLIGAACMSAREPKRSESQSSFTVDPRREEISKLWHRIGVLREQAGLLRQPDSNQMRAAKGQQVTTIRECNGELSTTTCDDTCSLKDAICDNAESICRIADELEGDSWAAEKCDSAKGSCREATERCCSCLDSEKQEAPGESLAPSP